MDNKNVLLDTAIDTVLQSLRELECDGDSTTNSMEDNIIYIMDGVFNQIYSSSPVDVLVSIGICETIKNNILQNLKRRDVEWTRT